MKEDQLAEMLLASGGVLPEKADRRLESLARCVETEPNDLATSPRPADAIAPLASSGRRASGRRRRVYFGL
jgi:hypothetical protein